MIRKFDLINTLKLFSNINLKFVIKICILLCILCLNFRIYVILNILSYIYLNIIYIYRNYNFKMI